MPKSTKEKKKSKAKPVNKSKSKTLIKTKNATKAIIKVSKNYTPKETEK